MQRTRREANRWFWDLDLDGRRVATAGHSFDRLVRCEQACAQFAVAAAGAGIRNGLLVTGARRWQAAVS